MIVDSTFIDIIVAWRERESFASPLRQFMDGISSEHVRDETREENPYGKLFFFLAIT